MLLLLVKIILPLAQAVSPRSFVKVPVDIHAFQGRYEVVHCPRATSSNVIVSVEGEDVVIRDSSSVVASFVNLESDGYGTLRQTLADQKTGTVTTNTLQLRNAELMVDSKKVPFGSYGFGVTEEKCELKRVL